MITKKLLTKLVVYGLVAVQTLTPAFATSIASTPVDTSTLVPPNIIFALDDSGSMDMEVLQDTEDGSFWFTRFSSTNASFFNTNGKPNFNRDYRYGNLFPNGSTADARTIDDSTPMYAIPPLPEYAYARSHDYNSIYYNPSVTYLPWEPAYIGAASQTFAAANPLTPRSHPVLPLTGTPVTEALTVTRTSEAANTTFKMVPGMSIPAGTRAKKNGGSWTTVAAKTTIPTGDTYDVALPFYPATYWVKVASCPAGGTCVSGITPDGATLQRFEIKNDGTVFPSGRTYADELQNFANWFQYYRKRKLFLAASMGQVLSQLTSIRGGVARFNDVKSGVRPTVSMYDFASTDPAKNWQAVLGTVYQNPASGGTPTRDALTHVGNQYMRTDTNAPVQYACQRNAAMVLTDGFATATNSANVPSYTKATYGAATPYDKTYTNTLADISLYFYTTNLRDKLLAGQVAFDPSDTSPNADKNRNIHMNTYALTLGVNGTIFGVDTVATADPFTKKPVWPSTYNSNEPTAVDDLWHATINGRGLMMSAADSTSTAAKVQEAISDVIIKAGAQSAVAVSRVNLKAGDSTAYISSYQVNGWYGDLQAYAIDPATGVISSSNAAWSAQTMLDQKQPGDRLIAITDSSGTVPFRTDKIAADTKTMLNLSTTTTSDADDVLNWLRGDRSKETTVYRKRQHILGDLVYSEPEVVKGAAAAYLDAGYADFAVTVASRARVLYEGGNDGMLHAFDAATGAELWAYIPSLVIPNLKRLASKSYSHQFYVDGTPVAGDVDFGSSDWHTILVSGLRAGGKGFFALDVTNPVASTEDAVASKFLWQFPNAGTPAAAVNNMGLSFGKPIIAKIAGQGWVVIVSSGYNNTAGDGKGHLFVLNAKTGALIADVATSVGSSSDPSGLAQLSAFAANGQADATVDTVYGGDLKGNLWRFNLKGDSSTWSAVKLAVLTDGTNPQPITSAPELSNVSTSAGIKKMVFVGTGQLLHADDIPTTQTQSFYGIVDDGSATPLISNVRTKLFQKTLTGTGADRNISGAAVDYSTYSGWYFDLSAGERVSTDPQAAFGAVVFTSNLPSSSACSSLSYLYTINLATGGDTKPPAGMTAQPARQLLGQALASRPVILVTTRGTVRVVSHLTNNSVVDTQLPVDIAPPPRTIAWKPITR